MAPHMEISSHAFPFASPNFSPLSSVSSLYCRGPPLTGRSLSTTRVLPSQAQQALRFFFPLQVFFPASIRLFLSTLRLVTTSPPGKCAFSSQDSHGPPPSRPLPVPVFLPVPPPFHGSRDEDGQRRLLPFLAVQLSAAFFFPFLVVL